MEINKFIDIPRSAKISDLIQRVLFALAICVFCILVIYEMGISIETYIVLIPICMCVILAATILFFRTDMVDRFMLTDNALTLSTTKGATRQIPFVELEEIRLVPSPIMKSYTTVMIKTKVRKAQEDYYHQPIGKDGLQITDALKAVGAVAAGASFRPGQAIMADQKQMGNKPDIHFWVDTKISTDVKDFIAGRIS